MTTVDVSIGARADHHRRKVYVEGDRAGVRVPWVEVSLSDSPGKAGPVGNAPVLLYDTSGSGSVPEVGLPALRHPWITDRSDVTEYQGRLVGRRDDGRGALRRSDSARSHPAPGRRPLRSTGGPVTQMHYARLGEITPEMSFVAIREGVPETLVREELAAGRAILPTNVNHPESEPMIIGSRFLVKVNANIGNSVVSA
jgi:phosphomethylpyrimidine synthase